LELMGKK